MRHEETNGTLVAYLEGRIDSTSAPSVESELLALSEAHPDLPLELDATHLDYISSVGLRAIIRLLKQHEPGVRVSNANREVYDVFEVTGFSEMMEITRALRELSVEGCELIGKGGNGAVYRLDAETIVKSYHSATETLEKIQKSRESAQKLMVLGIPVAIAFDVVRVADGYGLVYELLNCKTVGQLIHEDPSSIEHWAHEAAELLRLLHSTEAPAGTFPDARDSGHHWVEVARDVLSEEQQARLHRIYDNMEPANTLVHGDFHMGNMMVQGSEIVLIDTDDVAQGDPAIDMGSMELTFGFITTEEQAQRVMGRVCGRDEGLLRRLPAGILPDGRPGPAPEVRNAA